VFHVEPGWWGPRSAFHVEPYDGAAPFGSANSQAGVVDVIPTGALVTRRLADDDPPTGTNKASGSYQGVERWTESPRYGRVKRADPLRIVAQVRGVGTDDTHARLPAEGLHRTNKLVGAFRPSVDQRDGDRRAVESDDQPRNSCPRAKIYDALDVDGQGGHERSSVRYDLGNWPCAKGSMALGSSQDANDLISRGVGRHPPSLKRGDAHLLARTPKRRNSGVGSLGHLDSTERVIAF